MATATKVRDVAMKVATKAAAKRTGASAPRRRSAGGAGLAASTGPGSSASSASQGASIDRVDRAILRLLQRDASISNVALAGKVNLSAPACLRRVERLKEAGLLRGIVGLLNPKALDAGMLVTIGVVLDRSTPESFAAFEQAAQKVSGCMECHIVTGEFDCFMMIRTKDSESFNKLHAEQLLYLPGVRQIRTFVVLKEILSTTAFPI